MFDAIDDDEVGDVTALMREIIDRSVSDEWATAKLEWSLHHIEDADEYGDEHCLCGHAIREMCWLKNRHNNNMAMVGNVCVTRFMNIRSDLVFAGFRRIVADNTKAPNAELVEFAFNNDWLTAKEYGFLSDTLRKRKLSNKQETWRMALNQRIISRIKSPTK